MKRARFSEEQIISILNEAEAGAQVTVLCRRHGISDATFYTRYAARPTGVCFPGRRGSSCRRSSARGGQLAEVDGWSLRPSAGLEGSAADALALRASCDPRIGLFNTLLRFFSVAKSKRRARVTSQRREIRRIGPNRTVSRPLRCPHDRGNPRTRANFAGFLRTMPQIADCLAERDEFELAVPTD